LGTVIHQFVITGDRSTRNHFGLSRSLVNRNGLFACAK
jgi:hypothetical protein